MCEREIERGVGGKGEGEAKTYIQHAQLQPCEDPGELLGIEQLAVDLQETN